VALFSAPNVAAPAQVGSWQILLQKLPKRELGSDRLPLLRLEALELIANRRFQGGDLTLTPHT
jgi:hypothetical protein